ncbi:MAG: DegT/DnrJ/EryC1/StrS family aminotransferase [Rhizobiaceae bacterium]
MFVPHNRLTHDFQEVAAVERVVRSGHWATGPETQFFEAELAYFVGRRRCIAVGSGLAALRLALLTIGARSEDEIIIPAYGCVALANAVLACGAKPVTADVIPGAWTLDPASVANLVGKHTKGIVAVHTFGVAARIDELRRFGIPVIEDCAHGLSRDHMGTNADIAITSLYATKLLGAGEGGALLGNDDSVLDAAANMRDYTDQAPSAFRMNDKLTDLEAALARVQLAKLDTLIDQRRLHAQFYSQAFADLEDSDVISLPVDDDNRIWYRYAIQLRQHDVETVISRLRDQSIGAEQPVWPWEPTNGNLRHADQAYRTLLSIPLYPTLTGEERGSVVAAVRQVLE